VKSLPLYIHWHYKWKVKSILTWFEHKGFNKNNIQIFKPDQIEWMTLGGGKYPISGVFRVEGFQ
jgi:predicted phosphoadenosine phosphosulfate sulfurtransferase